MTPPFTSHTPNQVAPAGSTGKDFSVNQPALPNVGAAFGNAGPYANWVKIKTIPANKKRLGIEIANMTGGTIAVIRDDGTAANNAARVNASIFVLAGGAGAGEQGGGWPSSSFRGRLEIYAPAALAGSAYVAVLED